VPGESDSRSATVAGVQRRSMAIRARARVTADPPKTGREGL
jgi:hypothetical protein